MTKPRRSPKAHKEGLTLKAAALALGYLSEAEFDSSGTARTDGRQYESRALICNIQVQPWNDQTKRLRLWFITVLHIVGIVI